MNCIKLVSYEILVNGFLSERFYAQRGLRQGDPLSSYLFVLCTEGLSSLPEKAKSHLSISGIRICRAALKVTHLFFADGSIIFSKVTTKECNKVLDILEIDGRASGERINFDKSSILFSPNTPLATKQQICQRCNINNVVYSEKYLGLPLMVRRSNNNAFQSFKDRVWKRIQG